MYVWTRKYPGQKIFKIGRKGGVPLIKSGFKGGPGLIWLAPGPTWPPWHPPYIRSCHLVSSGYKGGIRGAMEARGRARWARAPPLNPLLPLIDLYFWLVWRLPLKVPQYSWNLLKGKISIRSDWPRWSIAAENRLLYPCNARADFLSMCLTRRYLTGNLFCADSY